eukprot:g21810.t1
MDQHKPSSCFYFELCAARHPNELTAQDPSWGHPLVLLCHRLQQLALFLLEIKMKDLHWLPWQFDEELWLQHHGRALRFCR